MKKIFILSLAVSLLITPLFYNNTIALTKNTKNTKESVSKKNMKKDVQKPYTIDPNTDIDSANIKIFQEVFKNQDKNKNFILSPLSIQKVFDLLALGTDNRKDFKSLAIYDKNDLQKLNLPNSTMESLILIDKSLSKNVKKIKFDNIKIVDFPKQATKEKMDLQKRVLDEIIDPNPLKDDTTVAIFDAIRYYSEWVEPFKKSDTKDLDFTTANNKKIKVPTMYKYDYMPILVDKDKDMIRLQGKNDASVYFIKPKKDIKNLDIKKAIEDFNKNRENADVKLYLPKVDFKSKTSLEELFKQLGFGKMFKEFKLEKLLPSVPLKIAQAKQVATLKIDEKGAEAKAITSVEMTVTSIPKIYEIRMNSPYYIVMADYNSELNQNIITFIAYVANPLEKE